MPLAHRCTRRGLQQLTSGPWPRHDCAKKKSWQPGHGWPTTELRPSDRLDGLCRARGRPHPFGLSRRSCGGSSQRDQGWCLVAHATGNQESKCNPLLCSAGASVQRSALGRGLEGGYAPGVDVIALPAATRRRLPVHPTLPPSNAAQGSPPPAARCAVLFQLFARVFAHCSSELEIDPFDPVNP